LNPLLAALAAHAGGGAPDMPDSISVDPSAHPSAQQGAGDAQEALKQAIKSLHTFVDGADDEQDRQVALQCYAKLQSILANEQKEKESALGVTPQTKYLAKQSARGSGSF
jgi:hypothetical protein